jgi:hypothetical protein
MNHFKTPWLGLPLVTVLAACSAGADPNVDEQGGSGSEMSSGSAGQESMGSGGGSMTTGGSGGANAAGGSGGTSAAGGSGGTKASGGSGGTSMGGAGGSSVGGGGRGGSGGSGGSVPIVVTDCGSLPAVGKWELIDPPEFAMPTNMEVLSVVVAQQDQAVYASAGNKTNGGN